MNKFSGGFAYMRCHLYFKVNNVLQNIWLFSDLSEDSK